MRRFIRNSVLLALPFFLYFGAALVIDPFEHFGWFQTIPHAKKQRISGLMHHPLWKIHQFARDPARRVIFGDSRLDKITPEQLHAATGEHYFNFCFGGGTIAEMSAAFWFVAERTELEEVTLGISFFNFSANENMNRFTEARAIFDDSSLYFVNRTVARASAHLLWEQATSGMTNLEKPPMDREAFWDFQLRVGAPRIYGRYVYPEVYEQELERIAKYCRDHRIVFRIVVPPSHADLQAKVAEFGLISEEAKFRQFVRRLAPTIDFDIPSELTRDRARFGDPFHAMANEEIVGEVWGGSRGLAVHTTPDVPLD